MTNKEFFLATVKEEAPKFRIAIEALSEDQNAYKVHDRAREAGNIASQLALQWKAISGIIKNGAPDFNPHDMENQTKESMLAHFDEGATNLLNDIQLVSEAEWENADAAMGEMWVAKKYIMAWGFLFDAIHHRGQLTTYLRAMGAKVPPIYGPSADSAN